MTELQLTQLEEGDGVNQDLWIELCHRRLKWERFGQAANSSFKTWG